MFDVLESGTDAEARKWQRKHKRRKEREAAAKMRKQVRIEKKADLAKRMKKWKARAAEAKTAGLPPISKQSKPRDMRRPQWDDLTGRRFGMLTVLRICPVSWNGKNHGRTWICRCDCGSPDKMVRATTLKQGNTRSCGCLRAIAGLRRRGVRRTQPLSQVMLQAAHDAIAKGDLWLGRLLKRGAVANVREERARAAGRSIIKLRGKDLKRGTLRTAIQ